MDEDLAEDIFWPALVILASSSRQTEQITTIKFGTSPNYELDWTAMDDFTHAFVDRLLPLAILLYQRGIVFVDKYRRDVSSFAKI
jgi:hypothetical protein